MNAETLLMIPRLYLLASRIHKEQGRPVYLGRICAGLALLAVATEVGVRLVQLLDCDPFDIFTD